MIRTTALLLAIATLVLTESACGSLIDGRCEQGLTACGGQCVALDRDPENCGGCGVVCADGTCSAGACRVDAAVVGDAGAPRDGGVRSDSAAPDAWAEADGGIAIDAAPDVVDASLITLDAAVSEDDAAPSDAGPPPLACDLAELACDGVCVRALSDPSHCGACDVACAADEGCSAGTCTRLCATNEVACGRSCVDTTSDAANCGACSVVCESGICSDGACVTGRAGHVVILGHDYSASRGAMDLLLADAMWLSGVAQPRVLHYVGTATDASAAGVAASLARTSSRPRTAAYAASAAEVPLALATADVLLVYPQAGTSDDALDAIGAAWARALVTFLAGGGVVIALDAPSDTNANGASGWLASAHLATATARSECSGVIAHVAAPGDALVIGVPLSYRAETRSVRWIGADVPVIVQDDLGAIAMHHTVVP